MSFISNLAKSDGSLFGDMIAMGVVFDPFTMTLASLGMTAAGAGASAAGTIAAGNNAAALGQFQQQEYNAQAQTALATGQRSMLEQERQTGLVQSQLQARAASSGASATGGSPLSLSRQIAGQGEYNALMDFSQGQNQSVGLTNMGDAAKYQGDLSKSMAPMSAFGSVAGAAGSAFRTLSYGGVNPFGGGGGDASPSVNLNNYAAGNDPLNDWALSRGRFV